MKSVKLIVTGGALLLSSVSAFSQSIADVTRAIDVEKYTKAESMVQSLIKANPTIAENYYYLGEIMLHTSRMDSAKIIFTKGITTNPQFSLNYIGLAEIAMEQDNATEAQKALDRAIQVAGTKDVQTLIKAAGALVYHTNTNGTKALVYLNQAASVDPKNPRVYLTMGDAYLADNNGGQAVSNYEKATELNKGLAEAYTKIGVLYLRARNASESEKALNQAIAADVDYAPAYRELAELYYQKKQYKEATESFTKYLGMVDNTVATKIRYAKFLFLSKDYAKTVEVINEVFKTDSSNVIMKRLLGYSLYEQKQYVEGLKYMEKFFAKVDAKKILAEDYIYYGRLLVQNNQDSIAVINLKKALEMDDTKAEVYSEIAEAYYHSKKYLDAAIWYENKINTVRKGTSKDQFRLAQAYYYGLNYKKADSTFAIISKAQPTWIPGYQWRGRSNSQLEATDPATYSGKPHYEKVIELGAVDPVKNKVVLLEAYDYLGAASIQKEDNAAAKGYYQKIIEIDPENVKAKDILKRLK